MSIKHFCLWLFARLAIGFNKRSYTRIAFESMLLCTFVWFAQMYYDSKTLLFVWNSKILVCKTTRMKNGFVLMAFDYDVEHKLINIGSECMVDMSFLCETLNNSNCLCRMVRKPIKEWAAQLKAMKNAEICWIRIIELTFIDSNNSPWHLFIQMAI